jgi:hypothetical protein
MADCGEGRISRDCVTPSIMPPVGSRGFQFSARCARLRGFPWDDGPVTVADEVDTLLFDVLGTVVDEAGSMHAELAAALGQIGAGKQADALTW